LIGIADALADIVYVVYGAALTYGIDLDAVLREVHRSNMSKLDSDGKPVLRADGKVLKSDRYVRPDIAAALGLLDGA
jgi:predicted HAD superfamily Cof-like phosphohydrolase